MEQPREVALLKVAGIADESHHRGGPMDETVAPALLDDDVVAIQTWSQRSTTSLEDRAAAASGSTALVMAARAGSVGALRALIDLGADVDAVTDDGATALMVAAQNGHSECVRLLIEARADVNARTEVHAATALHLACREGHISCARQLAEAGAALNDVVKTSELFANGATALTFAVFHSYREIEFILRQIGAPDAPLTRDAFRSAVEWRERF